MSKAWGVLLPEGQDVDPSAEGAHAAAEWRRGVELKIQGVEAQIAACVLIFNAIAIFGENTPAFAAFFDALVAGGVLSQAEARRGAGSPKLVKLRKIGQYADLLRREQMRSMLSEAYTVLYQTAVLFESLPEGDDDQRFAQLISVLQASTTRPTRKRLIDATHRAKTSAGAALQPVQQLSAKPGPPQTLRDLIAAGQRFELVVATPSRNDFRLLGADFPDLDRLERDLPLFKLMEEDAAVIIAAHLSDLPIIVTKLLPLLSFERPSCVWLAQRPATRDVTDAEIVVIGHRRGANLSMSAVEGWPNEGEPQDILELAGRLFPDVARKLHVFAQAKTDGWLSLSSEDTWIGPTI